MIDRKLLFISESCSNIDNDLVERWFPEFVAIIKTRDFFFFFLSWWNISFFFSRRNTSFSHLHLSNLELECLRNNLFSRWREERTDFILIIYALRKILISYDKTGIFSEIMDFDDGLSPSLYIEMQHVHGLNNYNFSYFRQYWPSSYFEFHERRF